MENVGMVFVGLKNDYKYSEKHSKRRIYNA
jgi:hypothetical protein